MTRNNIIALCGCQLLLVARLAPAQSTTRVSVDSAGLEADGPSGFERIALSGDGRFIAFSSEATNLVPGDTNGVSDIFVHDRSTGVTQRVSVDSSGLQGDGESRSPSISADGRYVTFESAAMNLVPGDTNLSTDVFVHDRALNTTSLASLSSFGLLGDHGGEHGSISADGSHVAFQSHSTNIVPGVTGYRCYIRDLVNATTICVDVDSGGVVANGASTLPCLSADGRYAAFNSYATNLVAGDTNGRADIFVHDTQTGLTERVNVSSSGTQANHFTFGVSISGDGRYVAFHSVATNLVAGDTNNAPDVFLRDRLTQSTTRVSVASGGAEANGTSGSESDFISADGGLIVFSSSGTNLVPGDTNGTADCFVHDMQTGLTERLSVDSSGAQTNDWNGAPFISSDGGVVAFWSLASNLVGGDTNAVGDVFVRDRVLAGTDLCQPGVGITIGCPCSNPPGSAPRGCDNSAATGGAQLISSGVTSLSNDSLLLSTNGEMPSATSIVLQGNAEISNGIGFGQGVRCVGGALRRLYVKPASSGSISAPGAGDPSVSARSAALGDSIVAGTHRWYAVYYRDPLVLGGCPTASTYNITQARKLFWAP